MENINQEQNIEHKSWSNSLHHFSSSRTRYLQKLNSNLDKNQPQGIWKCNMRRTIRNKAFNARRLEE